MEKIIGRKREQEELMRIYHRKSAQFVAIYGRRRVGKTYLVRELFKDDFAFYHTGVSPVELSGVNILAAQLSAFSSTLRRYGSEHDKQPTDWMEAFDMLINLLASKSKDKRQVVFIDEMPWMDTPRSGFITAFEHFWNGWAAGQDNLMLIVCGSASSWISDNLINSYGGLYDRVTCEIQLSPFTLAETEALLRYQEVTMSRYDIIQLYMAVGGIPMYLSYVTPGQSLAKTIDQLFFARKAKLKDEYDRLFNSIFNKPEKYRQVVTLLAGRQKGYSRDEIIRLSSIDSGAGLSQILKTLEACDFIEYYKPFENNRRQMMYRLTDPFCLFYLANVNGNSRSETYWRDNENLPSLSTWRGRAFENLCLLHLKQIKRALGIEGVACDASAWTMRGTEDESGMQIDLILDRNDRVVNLCEMKFVNTSFSVDAQYEQVLRHRLNWMSTHVGKRKNVQMTLVTTYGLTYGMHSGVFQSTVTMDDLFV